MKRVVFYTEGSSEEIAEHLHQLTIPVVDLEIYND